MNCPSGKQAYPTKNRAMSHVPKITRKPWKPRGFRAYQCPHCRQWHLTKAKVIVA